MSIFNKFRDYLQPRKIKSQNSLPIHAGRSSIEENQSYTVIDGLLLAEPDFSLDWLNAIEHLATFNADVSYALDNIVQLGSTNFDIIFDDSVSDTQAKEMLYALKVSYKKWYTHSDGLRSLINDLLAQVVLTGAISAEKIIKDDLSGIDKVVLVSPKKIQFLFDKEKNIYKPYQKLTTMVNKGTLGYVPLNETTYSYLAIRRFNEKPYAIPPFLAAVESIGIEREMINSIRNVTKKLGVMGFLSVLVNAPKRYPNEVDQAYQDRCLKYLQSIAPEIEKGITKGYTIGFKDTHTFQMENISTNVAGTKELYDLNMLTKMSGLKQDPLMLGRNFSTTEALGRVILAKLTSQVSNYQKLVATFLEDLFKTFFIINGYTFNNIDVVFESPMIGDRVKEEDAYNKKINNLVLLYQQGIISQQQVATELGYEKADAELPRIPRIPINTSSTNTGTNIPTDPTNTDIKVSNSRSNFLKELESKKNFNYGVDECCGEKLSLTNEIKFLQLALDDESYLDNLGNDKTFEEGLLEYLHKSKIVYDSAVKAVIKRIGIRFKQLTPATSLNEIQDIVISEIYNNWEKAYIGKQVKVTNGIVDKWYKRFRTDDKIFGGKWKKDIPKSTFNLTDYRTIDFFKRYDELYLGKFITDQDTRKRITAFLRDRYIKDNLPIGKQNLDEFKIAFSDLMINEDWKIARIISTTTNKMRNYAAVNYMQDIGVTKFQIRGVTDRLQCNFCAALQGYEFEVKQAFDKVERISRSEPELIGDDSPFINYAVKDVEELKSLSVEQLQNKKIDTPPYHPNCRDRIVISDYDVQRFNVS